MNWRTAEDSAGDRVGMLLEHVAVALGADHGYAL